MKHLLFLFFLLSGIQVFCQSKKDQILILTQQLDSVKSVNELLNKQLNEEVNQNAMMKTAHQKSLKLFSDTILELNKSISDFERKYESFEFNFENIFVEISKLKLKEKYPFEPSYTIEFDTLSNLYKVTFEKLTSDESFVQSAFYFNSKGNCVSGRTQSIIANCVMEESMFINYPDEFLEFLYFSGCSGGGVEVYSNGVLLGSFDNEFEDIQEVESLFFRESYDQE